MRIMLVHGLFVKKTDLGDLWKKLIGILSENESYYIAEYSDGEVTKDSLESYSETLKLQIEEFKPDLIIAHSMGGLLVRYLLKRGEIDPVKVIFLETPNQGLHRWQLWFFGAPLDWQSSQDLLRGSKFLQELNAQPDEFTDCYVHIGGIYSYLTPWVFHLKGVKMKKFLCAGHYLMNWRKPLNYIKRIIGHVRRMISRE